MFKNIIKDSVLQLMSDIKLIRISVIESFSHTLINIWLFLYYLNTFLQEKFEKWLAIWKTASTVVSRVKDNNLIGIIIIVLVVIVFWHLLIHPIWQAGVVHYLNDEKKSISRALWKWTWNFFVITELNWLLFSFWLSTFMFSVIRMFILDIYDNIFVIILLSIWFFCVFFVSIFWPYTKYAIVLEKLPLFEAMKRSVSLAFSNFWITFKFSMIEFSLVIRFLLNIIIVLWIPFLIVYIALSLNILDNQIVKYVIWIASVSLLFLVIYINWIIEAFFSTYRFKIYKKIVENEEKE